MNKTIAIDPVTRIEGHAKVFIDLDDQGGLKQAGLIVNELRGFERILIGMEADRLPLITARICGVCPSAHHIAASRALDYATGAEAPPAAKLLRELLYMGHVLHSHALSLFVLQGPDLVLGLDADPATRNIVGVVKAVPEVATKALRIRTLGQKLNEMVGGRGTHPITSVAGGITFVMDDEKKKILEAWTEEAVKLAVELAGIAKSLLLKQLDLHPDLIQKWIVPAWSMGTVKDGALSFCEGSLRVVDEEGVIRKEFPSEDYHKHMIESVLDWSYMKEVRLQHEGRLYDYRVGPLARLNVVDRIGTPAAQAEFEEFRKLCGRPCHATIMNVYARVIEFVYAAERAQAIVRDPALGGETRVPAAYKAGRGVGHVEAPRGVLVHDYQIDDNGIVRAANLIVATQQNYTSINKTIEQAARSFVIGKTKDDALLNAIEFGIRCYDPCLSCATHALGRMPIEVVIRANGTPVHTVRRDSECSQ